VEDDYGLSPTRLRTKAGTVVTFKNSSKKPHTIAARDGSWSTGVIQPEHLAARRLQAGHLRAIVPSTRGRSVDHRGEAQKRNRSDTLIEKKNEP
jgi:plastocyanin